MEAIRNFVAEHRVLLLFAVATFVLSLVTKFILARVTRNVIERFQNAVDAKSEPSLENLPPEIANPSSKPTLQTEHCDVIKRAIDALRLSEQSKKSGEFPKSEAFKEVKSDMEDKFRTLDCEAYLKRVAAGELPAAQTTPDMRPASLPPIQF
jgi:hypothetical protein